MGAIEVSAAALTAAAHPLEGEAGDYDALMRLVGDARFVLLGEPTHGSHDFYEERARITQRLIREKGFSAVAVEADWPDAYRVNRFVRGEGQDTTADAALSGFERFPAWMWRNTDVVHFIDWLRAHNAGVRAGPKVGFYGLDLYSLFTSVREVLNYLDRVDPTAAEQARQRYACFDHYGQDSQHYGYATGVGLSESCQQSVLTQLRELQQRAADYMRSDGASSEDAYFYAQQNARLVKNAEEYYRTMFRGRVSSWNLRDRHMAETLDALARHLSNEDDPAKIVVWAHNSHIGDARATHMGELGEWNVGQLAREAYPGRTCLVGFSTYQGQVTATSAWDGPAERKRVRPGMAGSYEHLLHQLGLARFYLTLTGDSSVRRLLLEERLERAIGVLYLPRSERQSHYFHARLAEQFDAIVHIDHSEALVPLDATSGWHSGEAPETYPEGV